jgi:hypothetical protein
VAAAFFAIVVYDRRNLSPSWFNASAVYSRDSFTPAWFIA